MRFLKGMIYAVADDQDGASVHMPRECYVNCEDDEIYEHFDSEIELKKAIPSSSTLEECIFMLKTVKIKMSVDIEVIEG